MLFPKTDIPFARDDANRFLPAIVAVMVAITALLLAVGISFAGALSTQQRDVSGSIQIQITANDKNRADIEKKMVALLRTTQGVKDMVVLSRDDVSRLLKPWLGDSAALEGVSLPMLMDVKIDTAAAEPFNAKKLMEAMKGQGIEGRVATPQGWVNDLARALGLAQATLLMLAGCLMASLVGLAVLVARTSLRLHFKVVNLLHMFGATDEYILRQFQFHNGWLIGRGAAFGAVAAAAILLIIHIATQQMKNPVLPVIHFGIAHVLLFIALPLFIALVSLVATRFTVQSMLHRMH